MHKVKTEHLPEVHERRVFPFRPSRPSSPASSRLSTGALSHHAKTAVHGTRKHILTAHGIEFVNEPGPALHPGLRSKSQTVTRTQGGGIGGGEGASSRSALRSELAGLDSTHRGHMYHSGHSFGHHSVQNDMNPFLAHQAVPKWETTAQSIGVHYKHPEQTYTRVTRNRMPVFQINL